MISVGPYRFAYCTSGRNFRHTLSCLFGITSPQNSTRRSVSDKSTFLNALSFATTISAEGTQKIVLIFFSFRYSRRGTGWAKSVFGII